MNDLISRGALLEIFNHDLACFETGGKMEKEMYISVADMRKMIKAQPTAYNVEKVVQQLEQNIDSCSEEDLANCKNTCCRKCRFERIKRIVSNGGKE